MHLAAHRSNAGQFHLCLVGDDGAKLAASATAFGSAKDERPAGSDVRLHAGSADGTEGRR